MSAPELVNAFAEGRISRRTLIRRLVASGVSFGAAVAYAHLLAPGRAPARMLGDEYRPPLEIVGKILNQDLETVIEKERVRVRFTVPKKARVEFQIFLSRPERETGAYALIGEHAIRTNGPVKRKEANVPLDVNPPHSVDALRPLANAQLDLLVIARRTRAEEFGTASHTRTLQ